MKQEWLEVAGNRQIARGVWRMRLEGAYGSMRAGQFVQIAVPGYYLRRPFAPCALDARGFEVVYAVVGEGTDAMTRLQMGQCLEVLSGLGNGFDAARGQRPLLVGGAVGAAPLLALAKELRDSGRPVTALLGFRAPQDVILEEEFRALGCAVEVAAEEPGAAHQGFVTELITENGGWDHYYACGPEPMMRAVAERLGAGGQLSLESRMACGFGACMGCSMQTKSGAKRVCKDGPVFHGEELLW